MISASGTGALARTIPRPLGSTHPFVRPVNTPATLNRMPGSELYRHHNFGLQRPDRMPGGAISATRQGIGIPFRDNAPLVSPSYSPDRFKKPGTFHEGYVLDRRLKHTDNCTRRMTGRSMVELAREGIAAATAAGRRTFRLGVIGPGLGNSERQLVEHIALDLHLNGMTLDLKTITQERDPMSETNVDIIRMYDENLVTLHNGARILLQQNFLDFDADELPFQNADLVIAIGSTIYSNDLMRLTENIHNSLRPPTSDESGGQALFMYRESPPDYHGVHAWMFFTRSFNLMRYGVDVVYLDDMAHPMLLTRMRDGPLHDLQGIVGRVQRQRPLKAYRVRRGDAIKLNTDTAFRDFMTEGRLFFRENDLDPDVLSEDEYRRAFDLVSPLILSGQPVHDAVMSIYGHPSVISALKTFGPEYYEHIDFTPIQWANENLTHGLDVFTKLIR